MLRARLLVGLLAAGALIAVPAAAKEGVHAILLKPLPLDAVAGERIRVDWRLIDDKGRPFGASGIYLRADILFQFDPPLAARGRCR
jgi:hypothetical protein